MDQGHRRTRNKAKTSLCVEISLDKVAVSNLTNFLGAKGTLIKKALSFGDIRFEIRENRVAFPRFSELPDADEVKAYTVYRLAMRPLDKAKAGKRH